MHKYLVYAELECGDQTSLIVWDEDPVSAAQQMASRKDTPMAECRELAVSRVDIKRKPIGII